MDYLYINKTSGDYTDTIETIELGENVLSRHTSGYNSDNYTLAQQNGSQVKFSVVKIESMYYVSINNEYVLDYKKFMMFDRISYTGKDTVIYYMYMPCIVVKGCDVSMVNKMISILQDNIKQKIGFLYNIKYYIKSILV